MKSYGVSHKGLKPTTNQLNRPLVTNQTYTSTLKFYNFYVKLLMNKQVKTLNNKKIKYKSSKSNVIAHNRGVSHKGLKPTIN